MSLLLALLLVSGLHDDADFKAAQELYQSLEYEQALLLFEQLSVNTTYTPAEKAEAILWTALCAEGVGDPARAERLMKAALTRDIEAQLPVKVAPSTAERFEALRFDLKRASGAPLSNAGTGTGSGTGTGTGNPPANPDGSAPDVTSEGISIPILPVVLASGGVVSLAVGGVLGWLAADRYAAAQDTKLFVDERVAAQGQYFGSLAGAVVLGLAGAGLAGGATYLAVTQTEP